MNTSQILLTKAVSADAEAIRDIQATTWLDTYPNPELGITEQDIRLRVEGVNGERIAPRIEKWRQIISETGPTKEIFVAKLDGKVVGFGAAGLDNDNNKHNVTALYVLPDAQGFGVGSKLMQRILKWLGSDHDIYVIVASYNQKAINFYAKCGFQPTSRQVKDTPAQESGDAEIPEIEMVLKQSHLDVKSATPFSS